jgi:hypothetical protein
MTTLAIVARAPARHYPDGIAWAPTVGKLDVSDEHGHTVAVIDAALHQLKTKIPLGGDVGNTQYDAADGLIYSAGQSTNELVAIDPVRDAVVGRWPLPGCRGCGSASKAGPRLVMLRNSKTVSKAARVVEIGVGRNPQSICDSCFVPITCGRDGRGPALDADPQRSITVPTVRPVFFRQDRHLRTPGRFLKRKGSPTMPQCGQAKPSGYRDFSR